jgi:hypothetical protein
MSAETAEAKFAAYDFNADPAWKSIEKHLEFSANADKNEALMKRKRKFFQKNVDENLSLTPLKSFKEESNKDHQKEPETTRPSTSFMGGMLNKASQMMNGISFSRNTIIGFNYARLLAHFAIVWASVISFFLLSSSFGIWLYYKVFLVSGLVSFLHIFLTYGVNIPFK